MRKKSNAEPMPLFPHIQRYCVVFVFYWVVVVHPLLTCRAIITKKKIREKKRNSRRESEKEKRRKKVPSKRNAGWEIIVLSCEIAMSLFLQVGECFVD